MSDQLNSYSSPVNPKVIQEIELLDLPPFKKHHLRILSHCLEVFKEVAYQNDLNFPTEELLNNWCQLQTEKFQDNQFRELLSEQMLSMLNQLKIYSKKIRKNIFDINLADLIIMVNEK